LPAIEDDAIPYYVVMNHEEQYSLWPASRPIPAGWSAIGESGPRAQCLEYIERHWTDMRPRSLREQMERQPN
jgi:MbtH protein